MVGEGLIKRFILGITRVPERSVVSVQIGLLILNFGSREKKDKAEKKDSRR